MQVVPFEPSMTEEWEAFVGRHPLSGYGHLAANFSLAAATPGVPNVSLLVREGSGVVALLPLFECSSRTLRSIALRELVSGAPFPAGPLIDPSLRGKAEAGALSLLLEGVRDTARERGADRVLITYPNVTAGQPTIARVGYSPLLHHGYQPRPGVGLLLDLTRSPEELAAARKSGCRQSIAKAQAAGASVEIIRDREVWMSCHAVNVETLGSLALSESQMAGIWDGFVASGHATAFAVRAAGALAAVTVTVHGRGSADHWHGWRPHAALSGASHLGLWHAILAARENGGRTSSSGRSSSATRGRSASPSSNRVLAAFPSRPSRHRWT